MRVRVDADACVGDETCVSLCPDIFAMEGDVAVTKVDTVPEGLQESCQEAAGACPVEAIMLEE
jgi:ferredoxin